MKRTVLLLAFVAALLAAWIVAGLPAPHPTVDLRIHTEPIPSVSVDR